MLKLEELPQKLQSLIKSGFKLRKLEQGARPGHGENDTYKMPNRDVSSFEEAELMCSENIGDSRLAGTHSILLDIDRDAYLIPSTTEGHYHLVIPAALKWDDYYNFLHAAVKAGIVQQGFANAAYQRKHTALRLPWVKKPKAWEEGGAKGDEFIGTVLTSPHVMYTAGPATSGGGMITPTDPF